MTATKFLAIVSGTGMAVAAVAAMTPPVIGLAAAAVGLAAIGKTIHDALPSGGQAEPSAAELDGETEPEEQTGLEQHVEPEASPTVEQEAGPVPAKKKKKKKARINLAQESEEAPSQKLPEADEDSDEKAASPAEGSSDDDDGWQMQRLKPKRAPRTPEQLAAARVQDVQRHANNIIDLAANAVGDSRYPVRADGERAGCVTHGPAYSVPRELAADVRAQVETRVGQTVHAGGMELTIHLVHKNDSTYNITLHRRPGERNPQTKANVHVDNNAT